MAKKIQNSLFYVEFPSSSLVNTKTFYESAFGWTFEYYGPDYIAFEDGQLAGGFYYDEIKKAGIPLMVLWSDNLENTQALIKSVGGIISTPIFSYPRGRRFHFTDPTGNELSVCSE